MKLSLIQKPIHFLLLLSGICCLMLGWRLISSNSLQYSFMAWNLFLAWVPLLIMLFIQNYEPVYVNKYVVIAVGLAFWLLFLPNAPYIITDLMHLRYRKSYTLWYDCLMVFSFASVGMYTGLYSMLLAHKLVNRLFGPSFGWALILGSLGLSGFGIYLGRFSRWNSWDLFVQPHHLFMDILRQAFNPAALKLSVAFALVMVLFYFVFLSFIQLAKHESAS
ncbi:DUF1361 domain-containing protein [Cytophagaceae bacterium DM2B3-1]|uniref:DUF1361 domain-containing protein n=1 Tax=Xanthocytophaga flava TaxID=3048013 RepID=A0ABT7CFK2_9BACT|nr:DUF1361 domain-containing protein [Xanthocytophaga flavus]MDJ1492498.1 DUF1361 domain-containing protein [Xanthocytophaga flavus]